MKITRFATASLLGFLSLGSGACSLSSARWRMATYEVTAQVPESLTTGRPSTGPVAEQSRRERGMGGNLEPRSRRSTGLMASADAAMLPPLPLEFTGVDAGTEFVDIPKPDELTGMPRRAGSPELLMIPLHQETGADPDLPNSGPSGDTGAPGLLPPMYEDAAAPAALTDADVTAPVTTPVPPPSETAVDAPSVETAPAVPDPSAAPTTSEPASAEPSVAEPLPVETAPAAEHDAMESLLSVLRPRQVVAPAAAPVTGLASRGPLRKSRTP